MEDKPGNKSHGKKAAALRWLIEGITDLGSALVTTGMRRWWIVLCNRPILRLLSNLSPVPLAASTVDDFVNYICGTGSWVPALVLAGVYVAWDVNKNIRQWYSGSITGKRCAKNIISNLLSTGAGVAGGGTGVALGSFGGPVGTMIGGIIGSVIGGALGEKFCERVIARIFDLPKEVAVEKAYNFLGVTHRSSDHEVMAAYRALCLRHHPDKPGGNTDTFQILQIHMALIRCSKMEVVGEPNASVLGSEVEKEE